MQLTLRSVCLLAAVVLFVLTAIGVDVRGISFAWLGMALFAGSFVVPETPINR